MPSDDRKMLAHVLSAIDVKILDKALGVSIGVFVVLIVYVYFVPLLLPAGESNVPSYLMTIWSVLIVLGILASLVGLAGLAVVIVRYVREKSLNRNRAYKSVGIVLFFFMFLGTGSLQQMWNKYVQASAKPKLTYSTYESVKAQIDVCNVKSIRYESKSDMLVQLYRVAPDVDANGRQIGTSSSMLIHVADRKRALSEIEQLK